MSRIRGSVGLLFPCEHEVSDFHVRFESDSLIGRRSGEIRGTFWTAATYRRTPKHFASIAVFATVSLPMKRNLFWLGAFLTIVVSMFASQPSPSTPEGNFDVIIRNGTVYDGTGAEPRQADVAIRGDRIVGVGDFKSRERKRTRSSMRRGSLSRRGSSTCFRGQRSR